MRPLPSSTSKSSVRPLAPLFDEIPGGDQDSDDATLLSLLMAQPWRSGTSQPSLTRCSLSSARRRPSLRRIRPSSPPSAGLPQRRSRTSVCCGV